MVRNAIRVGAFGAVLFLGAFAFRANRANESAQTANTVSRIAAATATVPATLPAPLAASATPVAAQESVVFAGGCFWGVQAVFQHVKGVVIARSGYAGGARNTASYDDVSSGTTGHAESVRIVYDPAKVSYETLLSIFFSVVHDPTELNYQGPDHGTQYRSAIFTTTAEQKAQTTAFIAALSTKKVFDKPIVTQVTPLDGFYEAEAHHQDYATLHPNDMYIAINDAPKVENLKKQFPQLYRSELHQ
jgi:peptide-methionine (S)-S-oxide reductase